jgi:hypothetical protein
MNNDDVCPDCGGEMEIVTTAQCEKCPWKFTHPDEDAVEIELKVHLLNEHGIVMKL